MMLKYCINNIAFNNMENNGMAFNDWENNTI